MLNAKLKSLRVMADKTLGMRSARRILTGLAVISGAACVGWGLDLGPIGGEYQTVAAASKETGSSKDEASGGRVKINYFSASWSRVFQDLAESGDLEIVADKMPTGRFSRHDRTVYTRKDAIRIVNQELAHHGFRLLEKGQFLIVLEIKADRPEYPAAVLPKRTPKPVEEDVASQQRGFRSDTIRPREQEVDSAVYTEDVSEKSIRYTSPPSARQTGNAPAEPGSPAVVNRKPAKPRRIQQTSLEDQEYESEAAPVRRPHPMDQQVQDGLTDVGELAPAVTYRPRQLRATELSRRIYRGLRPWCELIDAGRNGLPAVAIAGQTTKGEEGDEPRALRPIEFTITIDEPNNQLLIDGSRKDVAAAMKLLKAADRRDDGESQMVIKPSTKFACEVADKLPDEIDRIRAAAGNRNAARTVARHPVDRPEILANQRERNVPEADEDFPPRRSALPEGANTPMSQALGHLKGEVNIEVIQDLNALIVTGNRADVDQVLEVIKQIEQLSAATAPEIHLLNLKHVDSTSMADLLMSVYERLTRFPGRATQPRQSVAIIPVVNPNALLIVAPKAEMDAIQVLADELDIPVDPEADFEVFQLKSAVANDVQVMITELFPEPRGLEGRVLVISDPRTNSLIVRAQGRDLDKIGAMIRKVDHEQIGSSSQLRVFKLKNALAVELAAVINAAIQSVLSPPAATGGGGGGGGGAFGGAQLGLSGGQVDEQFRTVKSTVLKFMMVDKGEAQQYQSGILSDIRITPDAHANSLLVVASERSMDLMAAVINTLDRPTSTVSVIKVFTLENADANQMVQQLNALFNNQPQGGQNARQQLGIALANADDASSSLVPLKFSVDVRTNSVIAVGSADAMNVVEAILVRLDQNNMRSRKNIVVRLNNAPATQIATAVTQFFQQQRDIAQSDPNLVSNVEQLEREVIVIPDTVSNNLLVSSTPRYLDDILAMIKNLDARPKQVVIQALIVEVQLNNTDEFGIELGLQSPVLFDRSLKAQPIVQTITSTPVGQPQVTSQTLLSQEGTPGFNFNNPGVPLGNNILADAAIVGGQSLTNFSLGRVNPQLGYGGLVLSAGSNSVNALLRALAARTKIQILSRPQIRALDSQLSEVFVGQTIPTVTSFQTNATTGVISPVLTQRDTGIGMQVQPRINQDGDIVIQMYAFRSQLSQQTVNVTTDSRGQPVGQRITDLSNVRTTVLVPSNSTIVIGGMISTRDETSTRKAPFLGDIPIIGQLFRYDSRSAVRSELLIFLTPRIVDNADEEECLKDVEMGRLHFIESEAEAAHGPLRGVPAPDELFDNQTPPWIGSGGATEFPVSPGEMPYIQTLPPSPTPIQPPGGSTVPADPGQTPGTVVPAVPPAQTPTPPVPGGNSVPPAPPLPDPNLTQINALRSSATGKDDGEVEVIQAGSWSNPTSGKKPPLGPRRFGFRKINEQK